MRRRTPPHKRTQPRGEDVKVLLAAVVGHAAGQDAADGDQRRGVRANEDGLGRGRLGAFQLGDLGVDVGDDGGQGGGEAVVELGDRLAARGRVDVCGCGGVSREDVGEVGFEVGGRRR